MNIIAYRPEHIGRIDLQSAQTISWMPQCYPGELYKHGPAISVEHDGRILASAGVADRTLWAFLSKDSGKHFVRIHKCALRFVSMFDYLEADAEINFEPGCRWLSLLGFQSGAVLRNAGPNGEDYVRYTRG